VSQVPAEIAGIGSTTQKLRVSPGFDPLKAAVLPEEYFVLSRIDGKQTLREVLLTTGLPVERAVAIVTKLRSIGALLLPNETAAPTPTPRGAPPSAPAAVRRTEGSGPMSGPPTKPASQVRQPTGQMPVVARTGTGRIRAQASPPPEEPEPPLDTTLPSPTKDELDALAERDVDLSDTERRRLLAFARLAALKDPLALFGVSEGADTNQLKRAYFRLSKEIHPDRFYGRQLGSFAARMTSLFETVSRTYAHLTGDQAKGSGTYKAVQADKPQTPQEYAFELFNRACSLEVGGDALGAMKLFAAAVRIDPQARYLRRAANCAMTAGQPKTAVEYAKKAQAQAPTDASALRLLATTFRAAGKLADAEEVLVMAIALPSANDVLVVELRRDLAEVRRLLQG
jgi:hypothetical protein